MKINKLNRGFTLIELLVVISIIAVLSVLLILNLNKARSKGRDTQRVTAINQLQTANELFYDDNGYYALDISEQFLGKYMSNGKIPVDPIGTGNFWYGYKAEPNNGNATKYQFSALLENNNSALRSDADISPANGDSWAIDGKDDDCSTTPARCIFDVGVK